MACVGADFSAALTEDGKVWTWGRNNEAQLGNGARDASTVGYPSPEAMTTLKDVTAIACGTEHGLAVDKNGVAWVWGLGSGGQLGDGGGSNKWAVWPQKVLGIENKTVRDVFAVRNTSWAVQPTGEVFGWGFNSDGQLGIGSGTTPLAPTAMLEVTHVVSIDGGSQHGLFRTREGKVWGSGRGNNLQLGTGVSATFTPVAIAIGM
jgi:alpha-tubulin suppressor-like RCC1 family protein